MSQIGASAPSLTTLRAARIIALRFRDSAGEMFRSLELVCYFCIKMTTDLKKGEKERRKREETGQRSELCRAREEELGWEEQP